MCERVGMDTRCKLIGSEHKNGSVVDPDWHHFPDSFSGGFF
jgi:hypothetical protein